MDIKIGVSELGMVPQACNSKSGETKAGGASTPEVTGGPQVVRPKGG